MFLILGLCTEGVAQWLRADAHDGLNGEAELGLLGGAGELHCPCPGRVHQRVRGRRH